MKRNTAIAVSILALSLTGCAGAAQAEPEPAPTVTVTAKPEIKEVEVIKEVTPQSCIDALDLATDAVEVFIKLQEVVPPALEAAVKWDSATLGSLTEDIKVYNQEIADLTPPMGVAAGACRASAQ